MLTIHLCGATKYFAHMGGAPNPLLLDLEIGIDVKLGLFLNSRYKCRNILQICDAIGSD